MVLLNLKKIKRLVLNPSMSDASELCSGCSAYNIELNYTVFSWSLNTEAKK